MVHLLERDPGVGEHLLDRRRVRDRVHWVGIQRLDHRPDAAPGDAGGDERVGVGELEQACLDTHPAADQVLAELDDAGLALVRGHELGQLGPAGDELEASPRIGLDRGRRGQRDRDALADGTNRPEQCRHRLGCQALAACRVVGMYVHDPGAGVDGRSGGGGDLVGRPGDRGVLGPSPRTVERGLQERCHRVSAARRARGAAPWSSPSLAPSVRSPGSTTRRARSPKAEVQCRYTSPTGFSGVPPPGPAMPVVEIASCAPVAASAPRAIASAHSAETAPCCSRSAAGTPSIACLISFA